MGVTPAGEVWQFQVEGELWEQRIHPVVSANQIDTELAAAAQLAREVVTLGLELGVPYEQTHTCYEGIRPACGKCDACVERLAAFAANCTVDPLPYK